MTRRCFARGRKMGRNPALADTRDAQFVFVGSECFKFIKRAGELGWQPPSGGPRLYVIPKDLSQSEIDAIRGTAKIAG